MARFFIDHPVFAMVIAIVIVILGAVAIPNLPLASYPEVVPPVVQISTSYLGGNSQDIEKTVAQPIEEQLFDGLGYGLLDVLRIATQIAGADLDHRRDYLGVTGQGKIGDGDSAQDDDHDGDH